MPSHDTPLYLMSSPSRTPLLTSIEAPTTAPIVAGGHRNHLFNGCCGWGLNWGQQRCAWGSPQKVHGRVVGGHCNLLCRSGPGAKGRWFLVIAQPAYARHVCEVLGMTADGVTHHPIGSVVLSKDDPAGGVVDESLYYVSTITSIRLLLTNLPISVIIPTTSKIVSISLFWIRSNLRESQIFRTRISTLSLMLLG